MARLKPADEPPAERVLVLTPTGRDGEMIRERLVAEGMACEVCADLSGLLEAIEAGAGAAIVAHEALSQRGAEALLGTLAAQEPWSDLPVLLLYEVRSTGRPRTHVAAQLFEGANVTLLQRPMAIQLLLSSVRSAVRARRRQYQMRDLHRELERSVQLADLFVSILGHDLRTPLGAIRLSAESILRLSDDPRALRPAGRILTSADRMTRMIEQLLDLARVRQGRGVGVHPVAADLGELCHPLVEELRDANPEARIQLERSGDLHGTWDPDRLGQVVSNLVTNAVQHGTRDQPITVALDGTQPSRVRLAVHSSGTIPPQLLPILFDAFRQQPSPGTPGKGGLGLGLFIAREIARAHGGELRGHSEGERTTFEADLPRQSGEAAGAPP